MPEHDPPLHEASGRSICTARIVNGKHRLRKLSQKGEVYKNKVRKYINWRTQDINRS